MPENKTRVDFNAPASLVERADAIADLLGVSRTKLLVDALRDEIDDLSDDDDFRRRLSESYYAGRIDFDVVESVLGTEDALRMKFLRDSIDREPAEPRVEDDLPTAEEFYDGEPQQWTPDEDAKDEAQSQASDG